MANGACFHRGDLHIHSFGEGGSYDVDDEYMTPSNIISKALDKKLSIISITDHNKISNSISAVRISKEYDILVIPGIEISTTQGHLLAYLPTIQELEDFYGKLTFNHDKTFCNQGIYDCLELVKKYNGFGILAHIEVGAGFEKTIGKFNQIFDQAFQHPSILALEIKNHDSIHYYTEGDVLADRITAMKKRNAVLQLPENHKLAKVISSDAHTMNAFGKNATGSERLTRFKMDELSFDSLRIALLIHDSRVRLEDDIPLNLPRFKEIKATGGILDGLHVELSNNMNCIIGGRGTGKSTLLTAIQEASNNPVDSTNVQNSDAWPSKIELKYEDEAGREFNCLLQHGKLECFDNNGVPVEVMIPLEAYSQGFTSFSSNAGIDEKDKKLLKFFDGFTNVNHLKKEDSSKITQLKTNLVQFTDLTNEVSQKTEVDKELIELLSKKEAYEKQNVGELMRLHAGLVEEEVLRKEIESSLSDLKTRYQQVLSDKYDIEKLLGIDKSKIHVGIKHVDNVLHIIQEFSEIVDTHQEQLNKELSEKLDLLRTEVKGWRSTESVAKAEIEVIKKKLDDEKIPYDETKFVTLSNEIVKLQSRKMDINKSESRLKEVKLKRTTLIKERLKINSDIHNKRVMFCTRINNDLSESVGGLFVDAKVGQGYLSRDFSAYLKKSMSWHRWDNSNKISNNISPLDFYRNMRFNRLDFLTELNFEQSEIGLISNIFRGLTLEKVVDFPFEERPKLTVTRHNKEANSAYVKDISELSLGQQQSIMLSILIQSDSCLPLIIDQPEDNLDSEFIFNTVVVNLRKCKEKRQIIIVTHNSNIGVLGDAELVIPLIAENNRSSIIGSGSIDNRITQEQCCEILEGGKLAFKTRKDIYRI